MIISRGKRILNRLDSARLTTKWRRRNQQSWLASNKHWRTTTNAFRVQSNDGKSWSISTCMCTEFHQVTRKKQWFWWPTITSNAKPYKSMEHKRFSTCSTRPMSTTWINTPVTVSTSFIYGQPPMLAKGSDSSTWGRWSTRMSHTSTNSLRLQFFFCVMGRNREKILRFFAHWFDLCGFTSSGVRRDSTWAIRVLRWVV